MVRHRPATPRQANIPSYRSDNCVKNHFYSRLRRAVRQLNRFAAEQSEEQISIELLYRIIETTEERFKPNSRID